MSRQRRVEEDCKSVKTPCKICLQTVTPKNGLRCAGACEAWVHYQCLNYTPGKIKDIKAGIIAVTCPCPDCKTSVPKEYIMNEPFSCNNTQCPANNPPSCEKFDCQANEMSRCLPPRCPPPGTLRSCSEDLCRDYSNNTVHYPATDDPCMQGYTLKTFCGGEDNKSPPAKCKPSHSQASRTPSQDKDLTREVMQQMCKTVGDLADQLNFLLDKMNSDTGRKC